MAGNEAIISRREGDLITRKPISRAVAARRPGGVSRAGDERAGVGDAHHIIGRDADGLGVAAGDLGTREKIHTLTWHLSYGGVGCPFSSIRFG